MPPDLESRLLAAIPAAEPTARPPAWRRLVLAGLAAAAILVAVGLLHRSAPIAEPRPPAPTRARIPALQVAIESQPRDTRPCDILPPFPD